MCIIRNIYFPLLFALKNHLLDKEWTSKGRPQLEIMAQARPNWLSANNQRLCGKKDPFQHHHVLWLGEPTRPSRFGALWVGIRYSLIVYFNDFALTRPFSITCNCNQSWASLFNAEWSSIIFAVFNTGSNNGNYNVAYVSKDNNDNCNTASSFTTLSNRLTAFSVTAAGEYCSHLHFP